MTIDTKSIETAVVAALASAGVKFQIRNVGVSFDAFGEDRNVEADAWRVTFSLGSKKPETFDFYTGVGLRKKSRHSQAPATPVAPSVASVLHCLLLDAAALDQSFENWCADYGYDEDSRKALATYDACCENGKKIARVLSRELQSQLHDLLQDY